VKWNAVGECSASEPELAEARKLYLERHANSKYWLDFEDFSFYCMEVVDVYYVGGFGVMGWVDVGGTMTDGGVLCCRDRRRGTKN